MYLIRNFNRIFGYGANLKLLTLVKRKYELTTAIAIICTISEDIQLASRTTLMNQGLKYLVIRDMKQLLKLLKIKCDL